MTTPLLITRKDINDGCRPCTADETLVNRCIEEAQLLDIMPSVGSDVYLRLFNEDDTEAQALMDGGTYTDGCGNVVVFAGLRKALLYYAYARVVRSSGGVSTRFDFVVKADQYSDSADLKAKTQAYNEAFSIADGYKAQCLAYMAAKPDVFGRKNRVLKNNRLQIKKIGY